MARKVAFETLGCKLNQYETDSIAAGFLDLGWEVASATEDADAYVVNTCTVTNKADKKSRYVLGKSLQRTNAPIVVVTGCFAEAARETLENQVGVTFVVPNERKNQIPALVDGYHRGETEGGGLPRPDRFGFPIHGKVFHTRASLKIQDGCDNFCSFCIIPSVRGRAISRPSASILAEARQLIAGGQKELVLTGVNMGRWTEGGRNFADLVQDLLSLDGDYRIRITSLEPERLDGDFARFFTHPKMSPHLHLCLQSGSPRILAAMGRQYSLEDYAGVISQLKSQRPDINLTTDIIVGFPGESEQEFGQSLEAIQKFQFGHVHVFPYSRRKDTVADRLPDQVAEAVKTQRSRVAREWAASVRKQRMEGLLGSQRRILIETSDSGSHLRTEARGFTEDYYPVRLRGSAAWNTFVTVVLTGVREESGEAIFDARLL